MDLWNEYEGRSIDGLFPLERLIRPEGRSAFFSTTTSGTSTVIRLIESHFDEEEILARWTGVSSLHQPNLLTLTRFGQAMMDETSLVYVVLEPTESDLSEILCERPLAVAETRQVAASLIPALQALHAKGFIHEHILPANVLAVGEMVKLRSDCIREAPEGAEGSALRSRDVQDLATLLLQALTQQRTYTAGVPLPAPFGEIIHNGITGTWKLAQMAAALEAAAPNALVTDQTEPAAPAISASFREVDGIASLAGASAGDMVAQPSRDSAAARSPHRLSEPRDGRVQVPVRDERGGSRRSLVLLAFAVICVTLFGAYKALHGRSQMGAGGKQASVPALSQPLPTSQPVIEQGRPAAVAPDKAGSPHVSGTRESWRVVAYTYNRQDQAAAKARSLQQGHASLHPAVFTPSGRAPFLVTLGGPLSRESAFALRDKLRRTGLPRDLYAQNYAAKSR